MRKAVKFFHTLASCGLIGALLGYMIVLLAASRTTDVTQAEARRIIAALCNYLLLPSLGVALITGLLSMAVHRPFQDMRWAWVKALLGLSMFEATLGIIQSKADYAASVAVKVAEGQANAETLSTAVSGEWYSLGAIMVLSLANIVLGIWRPPLKNKVR